MSSGSAVFLSSLPLLDLIPLRSSFLSQCFSRLLFAAFPSSAFLSFFTVFGLFSPCLLSLSFPLTFPLNFFFLIMFSLSFLPIFSSTSQFFYLASSVFCKSLFFLFIPSSHPLFSLFPQFIFLSSSRAFIFPVLSLATHLLFPSRPPPSSTSVSVKP